MTEEERALQKGWCSCANAETAQLMDLIAWSDDQAGASLALWVWDRARVAAWLGVDAPA